MPTPGTVYHRLVTGLDDPRGEPPLLMARAALLLATEPVERVSGRVTYSQQILREFGWIESARGRGRGHARQRLLRDLAGGIATMQGAMQGTMRGIARVVVVGATGAGKSILAQRLAARLGAEYVELDALFWDAGWTQAAPEVFRALVERATAGPAGSWPATTAACAISCGPARTRSSGSTTRSRSSCAG